MNECAYIFILFLYKNNYSAFQFFKNKFVEIYLKFFINFYFFFVLSFNVIVVDYSHRLDKFLI